MDLTVYFTLDNLTSHLLGISQLGLQSLDGVRGDRHVLFMGKLNDLEHIRYLINFLSKSLISVVHHIKDADIEAIYTFNGVNIIFDIISTLGDGGVTIEVHGSAVFGLTHTDGTIITTGLRLILLPLDPGVLGNAFHILVSRASQSTGSTNDDAIIPDEVIQGRIEDLSLSKSEKLLEPFLTFITHLTSLIMPFTSCRAFLEIGDLAPKLDESTLFGIIQRTTQERRFLFLKNSEHLVFLLINVLVTQDPILPGVNFHILEVRHSDRSLLAITSIQGVNRLAELGHAITDSQRLRGLVESGIILNEELIQDLLERESQLLEKVLGRLVALDTLLHESGLGHNRGKLMDIVASVLDLIFRHTHLTHPLGHRSIHTFSEEAVVHDLKRRLQSRVSVSEYDVGKFVNNSRCSVVITGLAGEWANANRSAATRFGPVVEQSTSIILLR